MAPLSRAPDSVVDAYEFLQFSQCLLSLTVVCEQRLPLSAGVRAFRVVGNGVRLLFVTEFYRQA